MSEKNNIRNAARVVLIDENDFVAVVSVRDGEYFKIPGGGIEEGEDVESAVRREAMEEAGCDVEIMDCIGEYEYLDPEDKKTIHHSVCFWGKVLGNKQEINPSDFERKNKFRILWVTFEEAEKLFASSSTDDPFGKEMNKRDWNFLREAKNVISSLEK